MTKFQRNPKRSYQIMTFRASLVLIIFLLINTATAQQKNDVIFTVDGQPVYTDEFLRVFNKNRAIVEEENRKSIDDYLELYINYKLKLKEAYATGLDTVEAYQNELAKYREQLVQPYLKDAKVTDALVKEAYDRLGQEVNASHILVRLNPKSSPADTLNAYNKIAEARNKILSGASFNGIAKEYSEDPSAQKNGGDLGYFTAFGMVYPFENAAYTTAIGEVSKPFKTSFGYHILKVNDKRKSQGEVEVAHIMIRHNQQDSTYAKNQIGELYAKLNQGDTFDFLAQQYSDDKASAAKGGRLQKFAANKMIPSFSKVAFSLQNENDISQPFETPYGWHIVRLIKKHPLKEFSALQDGLRKKIENSDRASAVGQSIANKLKNSYEITYNEDLKKAFLNSNAKVMEANKGDMIFSINSEIVTLNELMSYNDKQRNKSLLATYSDFLNEKILVYYKKNLESTNKDFAITLQEYKDGLLLFDLLQQKVWAPAQKDTVALENFFNGRRDDYMHNRRGDLIIATCTKEEKAQLVKGYLEANKTIDEIKALVNENPTIHVLFSSGVIEERSKKLPDEFQLRKGVSKIFKEGENQFIIVKVNAVLEPSRKVLKEARGLVVNDFQEHIEKEWIENLRDKHTVKINKRTLKKLNKEYPEQNE